MNTGMNNGKSYRLGLYEKAMPPRLSFAEKLAAAKGCGFDFVEMSIDESDEKLARLDMHAGEISEIHSAMDSEGIYLESICLSGHRKYPLGSRNENVRLRSLEIMRKAIELSYRLGIRCIQLAGYDVYYEESGADTREYFEDNLKTSVEYAEKFGVVLAFETMETPFMNTVAKALRYVNKIRSPYLKIYPDTGNITNSGADVEQDILAGKGEIVAAHLKETRPNVFREVKFGTGYVDFAGAARAYRSANVRKFLAEMWYAGDERWREEIAEANVYLRKFLDREFQACDITSV